MKETSSTYNGETTEVLFYSLDDGSKWVQFPREGETQIDYYDTIFLKTKVAILHLTRIPKEDLDELRTCTLARVSEIMNKYNNL